MWQGTLVQILIAEAPSAKPREVMEAEAVPGRGLVGDRYFEGTGTFCKPGEPDRELTLVAAESIADFLATAGVGLEVADLRRQLVTSGVPLNDLVGRDFEIGSVRIHGIRLCEPCKHLAALTTPEVLPALLHKAGLRAQVLTGGKIRPGDSIRPLL